jgi:hypothetical protein
MLLGYTLTLTLNTGVDTGGSDIVDTGGSDIIDTGGSDNIVGIVVVGMLVVYVPPVVGIIVVVVVVGASVPPSSSTGIQLVQHSGILHTMLQSTTSVSSGLGRKAHISVGIDPVK